VHAIVFYTSTTAHAMIGLHRHTGFQAREARVRVGVGELDFESLILFITFRKTFAGHAVVDPYYFRNFLPPYFMLVGAYEITGILTCMQC
jgi:hypothetical protein